MEQKRNIEFQNNNGSRGRRNRGVYTPAVIPEIYLRSDLHERQSRLAEVISGEIVPRLRLIHHGARPIDVEPAFAAGEISEFGALAMGRNSSAPIAYFEKLRGKGHSLDSLFVNFLAPTARHLGELWEQDRCDFIDVTLGVARLQELLDLFGSTADRPPVDMHHRALLISTQGEKHLFGIDMVAQVMRGAGWDVEVEKGLDPAANAAAVATEWYGVVGVTLSGDTGLDAVALVIQHVRRASANRAIGVMVGGPAFVREPELVARVGADAAAVDAPTAVVLAKKLLLAQAGAV